MQASARESLLNAAYTALARRPWSAVRMVDVAAAAGVSRQTLYNEFGGKEGLARALVRREADAYLAGIDRALAIHSDGSERLAAAAEWTALSARGNPLVRAMLTGCWSERLPSPSLAAVPSSSALPAQRRADGPLPSPADFVVLVRDRAVDVLSALGTHRSDTAELTRSCELVVRLALSCVTAPPGAGGVTDLVRNALHRQADVERVHSLEGDL
ncbi:TetR/AcrR family transcriptional regulator (plasmid) [Streptomyces sp. R39]|uniref:TetR/AcrR family transcriptional regulator n=1 Tax=Streptomyces sp. R39 TaxID=3238631 RepID=A0AB39R967_9ACTN